MRLVLFEVFGHNVYSYGLMIAIGVIVAGYMFTKRAEKLGYDEDKVFNLIVIAVICGVLGGKLLFIITEFKNIIKDPSILLNFGEGFVIYGAIILGALSIYIYCRKNKWNTVKIFDCVVPGVALAQGFGRIGCFLAGCCYGAETTGKFGVIFPEGALAPAGVSLYPTQVYSAIFDFALAAFLIWYSKRNRVDGHIFSLYVIIYSVGRFLVEFLRNDPRGNVGVLSTSQFIAIFTFIFGLAIYFIQKQKERKKESEEV